MSRVEKNLSKTLHVSQNVIADIISNAVKEVDGVLRIAPAKKTPAQLLLNVENYGSIKIGLVDDVLSVSVGIILKNGAKAIQTAENVQNKIKSSVQGMLGLTVAKVNVKICNCAA